MTTRQLLGIIAIVALATQVVRDGSAGGVAEAAPARAPERLSDTGLYADIAMRRIADGNLPFEPQYPLWTDGAEKARWIRLPEGAAIDASDTARWEFPVGTKLWKDFAFDGRTIETRMLWRASSSQWVFASYLWNDAQTEAILAPAAGVRNHREVRPGVVYSIPSDAECHACHDSGGTPVLGFNALQLSDDRDPLAPHAKVARAGSLTIRELDRRRLLRPRRPDLVANPPRIAARSARERAVLGYFSANCGSCHNESGPLAVLGLHLRHGSSGAEGVEPGYVTAVGVAGEYVTPGATPERSRRIAPGDPDSSAIVYRMSSRRPSSQMPPLGTSVVDEEAVALIRAWIAEELRDRGTLAGAPGR